jgi:hypothetical protein
MQQRPGICWCLGLAQQQAARVRSHDHQRSRMAINPLTHFLLPFLDSLKTVTLNLVLRSLDIARYKHTNGDRDFLPRRRIRPRSQRQPLSRVRTLTFRPLSHQVSPFPRLLTDYFVLDSIIAIHGLNGNQLKTWTEPKSKKLWLRDFLPKDLQAARVMAFGYNATAAFDNSVAGIRDHARGLLGALLEKRDKSFVS